MQRVFRLVDTAELEPVGMKTTTGFDRSVARHGIINPIIVAEVPDADGVIGLEIVDGNRRARAAKMANMDKIPAVVLKETSAEDRARLTLMTNQLRSYNFHTESLAISSLADDEASAKRAADYLGISAIKLQNMMKKLGDMPEPIRRAMYEDRIPVSSATSIASWPEELQDRIVEMLQRKRRLYAKEIDEVKRDYERLHPPPPKRSRQAAYPPMDSPDFEEWIEDDPVAFVAQAAAPATLQPAATPPPADAQPGVAVSQPPPATEPISETVPAEPGNDPRLFVGRLDEALLALARETRANNLIRAAWIDRCMRAWDMSERE